MTLGSHVTPPWPSPPVSKPPQAENVRVAIAARPPVLAPEEDEQLLLDAGFSDVNLFYAGFAFRGWIAYA